MLRFVIIDGHSLIHRAYHARSPDLRSPDGEPTKATYLFFRALLRLIRTLRPDMLAMAVDGERAHLKRSKLYPAYKGNRPSPPDDLRQQLSRCRELAGLLGIPILASPGYEADDVIATLVTLVEDLPVKSNIVSRDKDLFQLLRFGRVSLYDDQANTRVTARDVMKRFGFHPAYFSDYLALVGDSSDNIPGAKGIGPVAAGALIRKYETVEGVYNALGSLKESIATKLRRSEASVVLSKKLTTLRQCPLTVEPDSLFSSGVDMRRAAPLLKQLGFRSFVDAS